MEAAEADAVIDECTLSEWYTANVFHAIFPKHYRYDGSRRWSFWDDNLKQWLPDENCNNIKTRLRCDLSERILKRAKYWQQRITTHQETDTHAALVMIQRLLTISQKLQNEKYIRKILRELQEYYHNDLL